MVQVGWVYYLTNKISVEPLGSTLIVWQRLGWFLALYLVVIDITHTDKRYSTSTCYLR